MFPREAARVAGQLPVFTPYPIPGDVDLVIASEMAETGRAIEKGFVTPNITTLIASSHRVYSMPEKEALGDGIMNLQKVYDVAERAAKQFVCFDMQRAADDTGSMISAVILGAIAASGALPFGKAAFEESIRIAGKAVDANLRGFATGFDGVSTSPEPAQTAVLPAEPNGPNGRALAARVETELPGPVQDIALHGALKALDYQDDRYANEYLDLLAAFAAVDTAERCHELTGEVARQLALQMCYEDTIRVADLKIRSERFARIRDHVNATADQPVRVVEYLHPRLEEVCDTLPAFLGRMILSSTLMRKALSPLFRKGRNISTTSISGFLLFYLLAKLRVMRRMTYRYQQQQAHINDWLERVSQANGQDYEYGLAVARCIEIVKGYGETYERGMSRYRAIVDSQSGAKNSNEVRKLHRAALADEKGERFSESLASLGAGI